MQIAFDADTPAQALADGPSEIALFQHGGGEWADWDAAKVQKENDTHPIVYPAAGSHATFYDDAIYIENGQNGSGVGCDNSSKPLTRTQPEPVIVPTHAPPGTQFEWLSYLGHWGQREKGFNIGPQGPVTKSQWLEPFTWMDGVRQGSPRLPGGTILGPAASTAFCGAIAGVSEFINLQARTTIGAIGLGVGSPVADPHSAAAHSLAPGRHLPAVASLGRRPAAARRAPDLRQALADDAALRAHRLCDPRGDSGPLVSVRADQQRERGLHSRHQSRRAGSEARRLVQRGRRTDRVGDRLGDRGRLHASAGERRGARVQTLLAGDVRAALESGRRASFSRSGCSPCWSSP